MAKSPVLVATSPSSLMKKTSRLPSMGIVLLAQKGKLGYDDLVSEHIPELSFYKGVTIRQLLNHTGGLPDYMQLIALKGDTTRINTNKDIIRLLELEKPAALFAPGTKYTYSNTGYAVLASVIETVSGQTFGSFMTDAIFKPLSMKSTFVYNRRLSPRTIENYAFGYVYDRNRKKVLPDGDPQNSYVVYLDGIVGDGAVNSTTTDLLKWDRALYTEKLVSKKALEAIFTPPSLQKGEKTDYGFGWLITTGNDYGRIANHSGGWPGYATLIERHLDNDKTIIVLQNNENSLSFVANLRRILYG
ncbi:MAG: class A beta-lactamase-related serine hydrolase, partial [Proteobacteria bacterium]